jgi:hypothetical protein
MPRSSVSKMLSSASDKPRFASMASAKPFTAEGASAGERGARRMTRAGTGLPALYHPCSCRTRPEIPGLACVLAVLRCSRARARSAPMLAKASAKPGLSGRHALRREIPGLACVLAVLRCSRARARSAPMLAKASAKPGLSGRHALRREIPGLACVLAVLRCSRARARSARADLRDSNEDGDFSWCLPKATRLSKERARS